MQCKKKKTHMEAVPACAPKTKKHNVSKKLAASLKKSRGQKKKFVADEDHEKKRFQQTIRCSLG